MGMILLELMLTHQDSGAITTYNDDEGNMILMMSDVKERLIPWLS